MSVRILIRVRRSGGDLRLYEQSVDWTVVQLDLLSVVRWRHRDPDGDPYRDADLYTNGRSDGHTDFNSYGRSDAHRDSDQCYTDGYPDQRDAYGYSNLKRRAHGDADYRSDSHGDGDRHSAAERSSDADFGRKRYVRTRSDG